MQECSGCGKPGESLLRCDKCKSVYYCSRDCQKKSWRAHKKECKPPRSKKPSSFIPIVSTPTPKEQRLLQTAKEIFQNLRSSPATAVSSFLAHKLSFQDWKTAYKVFGQTVGLFHTPKFKHLINAIPVWELPTPSQLKVLSSVLMALLKSSGSKYVTGFASGIALVEACLQHSGVPITASDRYRSGESCMTVKRACMGTLRPTPKSSVFFCSWFRDSFTPLLNVAKMSALVLIGEGDGRSCHGPLLEERMQEEKFERASLHTKAFCTNDHPYVIGGMPMSQLHIWYRPSRIAIAKVAQVNPDLLWTGYVHNKRDYVAQTMIDCVLNNFDFYPKCLLQHLPSASGPDITMISLFMEHCLQTGRRMATDMSYDDFYKVMLDYITVNNPIV